MAKLKQLYNQDPAAVGPDGAAFDMHTSRASGQLIVTLSNPGTSYEQLVTLAQAPTITGPWTACQSGGIADVGAGAAYPCLLVGYTRSARYLRASVTGTAEPSGLTATILAVEPGNLLSLG